MIKTIVTYCTIKVKSLLLLVSYLSIDVALGALAVGIFFWKISQDPLPNTWYFIFPLAVYGVYNLDHWLDIQSNSKLQIELNPRRNFHSKHAVILLISIVTSLSGSILLGFIFLSLEMILTGFAIGTIVIFHFMVLNLKYFKNSNYPVKEITVCFIYCLGTTFPLFLPSNIQHLSIKEFLLFIFLFCIVWNNLLINAISDMEEDKAEGFPSMPLHFGFKKTKTIFSLSTFSAALCLLSLLFLDSVFVDFRAILIFAFSLLLPSILFALLSRKVLNKDLVRMLGELPFILFFFA